MPIGWVMASTLEPVVLDLADLVPLEPGRVQDGFLEHRLSGAVGHHVEPEAFEAVLGHTVLVRAAVSFPSRGQPLDLDALQVSRVNADGDMTRDRRSGVDPPGF